MEKKEREVLLGMPRIMLQAWEERNMELLKGKALEEMELEISSIWPMPYRYVLVAVILILGGAVAWLRNDIVYGLGTSIFLLALSFSLLPNPLLRQYDLERGFRALKQDLERAGLLDLVGQGISEALVPANVRERLISQAQLVLLLREEVDEKRHNNLVPRNELLEAVLKWHSAEVGFVRRWQSAQDFGLDPGPQNAYFNEARKLNGV